jgi:succinate dehydrogenase hydrophobic anchor subunit
VRIWLSVPVTGLLSVLLIGVLTYHSYLGTIVIVEDYVSSSGMKVLTLMTLRFLYVLAGGAAMFAILRLVFGFARL